MRSPRPSITVLLEGLVDLVMPGSCALCRGAGAPLCASCRAELHACRHPGGAASCAPSPSPSGMPPCWAAGRMDGALGRAVTAYKDQDRRDLRGPLAALLATAVHAAVTSDPGARTLRASGRPVHLVPVPGSLAARRRRGDSPVTDLVRASTVTLPGRVVLAAALRGARATADQSRLDAAGRRENLDGAMRLDAAWDGVLPGTLCVVADDVVTTGATLAEAARVLRSAGADRVIAATVAATVRRGRQRAGAAGAPGGPARPHRTPPRLAGPWGAG